MNRKWITVFALSTVVLLAGLAVPVYLSAGEPETAERGHHGYHARGYLGVELRSLTGDLREHFGVPEDSGVLIAAVSEDGPADRGGVRVGDVVTEIDGRVVDSFGDVRAAVRHSAGDTVTVEVYRDGKLRRLEVEVGERRASWDRDWERWGERWGRRGEEMGEYWSRYGEEMGERWGKFGEEMGERWAERGAEWGDLWGEWGAELGMGIAEAITEMDWEAFGDTLAESLESLDEMDWEEMGEEIERSLERLDRDLEKSFEEMNRALEKMDEQLSEEE